MFDVIVREQSRLRFDGVMDACSYLGSERARGVLKTGTALVLATGAVTELSKSIFPLVGLSPLSQYPVLGQLSSVMENPAAIGVIAAIGAYYLGKDIYRNRLQSQAIRDALNRVQICPAPPHYHPGEHEHITTESHTHPPATDEEIIIEEEEKRG